jgi:hypothetical protein
VATHPNVATELDRIFRRTDSWLNDGWVVGASGGLP